MIRIRYSRWDGTQSRLVPDADTALEQLQKLMMEGLSAEQAMEWMERYGFELAGTEFRVMAIGLAAAVLVLGTLTGPLLLSTGRFELSLPRCDGAA